MHKVLRLDILKPTNCTWEELGSLLREVRYRCRLLANSCTTDNWLAYHAFVNKKEYNGLSYNDINKQIRKEHLERCSTDKNWAKIKIPLFDRISKTGVLPDHVAAALYQYKVRSALSSSRKLSILRGEAGLPQFKSQLPIPIRCDKPGLCRLIKTDKDISLKLMICMQPYPEVIFKTQKITGNQRAILDRLLSGEYAQKLFEVAYNENKGNWVVNISYEDKATNTNRLSNDVVVGVDRGFKFPIYCAVNSNSRTLGANIFNIQRELIAFRKRTEARRRDIGISGRNSLVQDTSRSGHGRDRRLLPSKQLQDAIDNHQTTMNHKMSRSIVDFAIQNGAGIIQLEDLVNIKDILAGTFLGKHWRYYQLEQFIKYKAEKEGIETNFVNPRYTSRRCSTCGWINIYFDREFRNKYPEQPFRCEQCQLDIDPDYNAAKNLSLLHIDEIITKQCELQGIILTEPLGGQLVGP